MILLRQILVATDFSEASRAAVDRADALASAFDAQLHLLHVVDRPLHEPWVGYAPAGELVDLIERLQREARVRLAGDSLT